MQNNRGREDMPISRRHSLAALGAALAAPARAADDNDDDDDMPVARIKLVILDIGGTLIQDHGEVPEAMLGAFSRHGMTVTAAEFSEWRGASKRGMVRHFVELRGPAGGHAALVETIYADFTSHVSKAYENVQPIAGAEDMLKELKRRGFLLATTTGFDRPQTEAIMTKLNWHGYFVASITSDDVVDGRPSPFMLFRAMEAAHVDDVSTVMAVGDTPLDLQAGDNAGLAAVLGVSSGAATEDRLRKERSTGVLPSVASLPALLEKGLPVTQWRCR
jgi:phosphonatase-like hydrolase